MLIGIFCTHVNIYISYVVLIISLPYFMLKLKPFNTVSQGSAIKMWEAKDIISDIWRDSTTWISTNPKVSAAIGTFITIWTFSQFYWFHKKHSFDEKDETTNIDHPRARRLLLSKLDLKCPDNIEIIEEYIHVNDGTVIFTRCYIPKVCVLIRV